MSEPAVLQHRDWWPDNPCFGCGPDNPHGLRIESVLDDDGVGHTTWTAEEHHQGPPGAVNGAVVAIPMDCHGAWTASAAARQRAVSQGRDPAGMAVVTAEYTVRLVAPTPIGVPLAVRAEVDHVEGRRLVVTVETRHEDLVTATFLGTFVELRTPYA